MKIKNYISLPTNIINITDLIIDGSVPKINNCLTTNLPKIETISTQSSTFYNIEHLIKNVAKNKNIDCEFTINDDKIIAYFVDEKDLYVKCNLFDYCNIEWFIEKNKSFDSCEEALSRIHLIKNKLNELEKIIFNLSLEQKDNNDE